MTFIKLSMLLVIQSLLFCFAVSCNKQALVSNMNFPDSTNNIDTSSSNNKNYRWLALGDSYTIGQSVTEDQRFPAQTISILKTNNINVDSLEYIATTGWTTQNLLDAIAVRRPQGPLDIVSLLIGVNDQYQHMDTAGYRIRFTECLQQAIILTGNKPEHVFVLSIPDYSVTPFASNSDTAQIRNEIDEFNAINKAITASYNISYSDITAFTREAKDDSSLLANDGLHPSGKEYAKWAAVLTPEIENILK